MLLVGMALGTVLAYDVAVAVTCAAGQIVRKALPGGD